MFLLTVATIWTIAAVTSGPNFLVVARCSVGGNRIAGLSGWVMGTACLAARRKVDALAGATFAAFGIRMMLHTRP